MPPLPTTRRPGRAACLFLLLGLALTPALAQPILISEIQYHPAGTNLLDEWIELRNTGATAVDLSGWRFSRGIQFTFPPTTTIAANGFLVVAANLTAFQALHPSVTRVVAGWTGTLSHDGEELRLENAQGQTVDSVSYAPEGDWAERRLGPLDGLGRQGWTWFAEHAGLGKSLELINEQLPNDAGQNWGSSLDPGGSPGEPNSIAQTNSAPLILSPRHTPALPRSSEAVAIAARLLDELPEGVEGQVHWRVDGTESFTITPLLDDGAHGDGLARDGVFGALLPTHPHGTVIEFYLTARDASGQQRTYPPVNPEGAAPRTAHLAYQVDDVSYQGNQPIFRLILTQAEYDYLANRIWIGAQRSDAMVNGTFIATDAVLDGGTSTQVRYLCGFRNRGHGSRFSIPHNFHVAFPADQPWKDRSGLNLNTQYPYSQQIGSALFRRAGIPIPESRPVQVRVNGTQLAKADLEQFGSYAANEPVNDRFVQRQFPLDPEGNLYRGIRDRFPGIRSNADLSWQGPDFAAYTNAYSKENHVFRNDWSDLLQLLDVLNHAPEATYAQEVRAVANPDQWMRYFAANTLLDNQENSLGNGAPDDFALYRGARDTRFLLLPYDMDSLLGRGTRPVSTSASLWRMTNVAVIDRFMKHPDFAPLYFRQLNQLAATAFAPSAVHPLLDQLLADDVPPATLANLKSYQSNHLAQVLALFPHALTVSHGLPVVEGYPHATSPVLRLQGAADPAETRTILVQGQPAQWTAWRASWIAETVPLLPGLNRLTVQALGFDGREHDRTSLDVWLDDGSVEAPTTTITTDSLWVATDGPFQITNTLTIAPGATLTIEAGTSLFLGPSASIVVADGGRLVAEGTATAPIRFTSPPGTASTWGGILIHGSVGSPETRLVHVRLEGNNTTCIESAGGTLFLDHATFGTTSHPYLSLDDSSFVVSDCHFPATTASFEPFHGTGGIKPGGRGIVRRCFFGTSRGYNDIVDFTGGNRPNQPIIQFFDNVFAGSTDDILDLDGTDAWIEGNLFLRVHRNGAPDTSAAVSGGHSGTQTSEITLIGNLFFDCDNAVTAKEGNFYVLLHNTIVRTTRFGGEDFGSGVVNLRDTTPDVTEFGRGAYLEGNLIWDAENLVRNHDPSQSQVTFVNNLLPMAWSGPGSGNQVADPLLRHIPAVEEVAFETWEQAQVLREWFQPKPGSPARPLLPSGGHPGSANPPGAWITGVPQGVTSSPHALIHVHPLVTDSTLPATAYPNGAGFTHYRWRLDDGPWSELTPTLTPITLSDLSDGPHTVEVSGRNDAGTDQEAPVPGRITSISLSNSWIVDRLHVPPETGPSVRLNEVLAHATTTTDWVELHNPGSEPVDLSGMGLSDNPSLPYKFTFPQGTRLEPQAFLRLQATTAPVGPDPATGFALKQEGDQLVLTDTPQRGSQVLDALEFGPQIPDQSLGRRADDSWGLCQPTPGTANLALATGDPNRIRINEWLADARFTAPNDFVELYNPNTHPADLSGYHLSDAAGSPSLHTLPPFTFIEARGHLTLIADGDPSRGLDHLPFRLSPEAGIILLSTPDLTTVDAVLYDSQRTDVPEGRSPDGGDHFSTFPLPTPGRANPGAAEPDCIVTTTTRTLLTLDTSWQYQQTANLDHTGWQLPEFNDQDWPSGPALLAVESSTLPSPGKQTELSLGRTTYYFRTRFVLDTPLEGAQLRLTMAVDDGALVYLDGVPVWTNGLPSGSPLYSTHATRNVGNASLESVTLPRTTLPAGTHVVAAEVHQANATSTDVVWGLGIEALETVTHCTNTITPLLALNEVLANTLPSAVPEDPVSDYVEIVNAGPDPVDLDGISLTDDPALPRKWVFAPATLLEPGQLTVVSFNPAQPASAHNAPFDLNARGGRVLLINRPDRGGSLLDAVQYGLQIPNFAIARFPAATGPWSLALPTPGRTNLPAQLAHPASLRINEWMADPSGGSDWLELLNTAPLPVSLAALSLTDDFAAPTRSPIAPLSFLGTGSAAFVQFFADGNPNHGPDHLNFALRRTGETIGLFSPDGILLDGLAFGPQSPGISQGRLPDGSPSITFLSRPSPGTSNTTPTSDSDGDGLDDTWEQQYFQSLARDGTGDFDVDGFPDRSEFLAGTNPADPEDALRITGIAVGPNVLLTFHAAPGRAYSVEFRDGWNAGEPWRTLGAVPSGQTPGPRSMTDPTPRGIAPRFYRVVLQTP